LENEDSSEVPAVNGSHQEDIQSTEEPPEDISDDVTEQGPAEDDQDAPQTIEEPEPVEPETSLPAPTQNGTANTSVPAKPPERHVRTRHHGPSMLEQVVSQTRPAHLPPKQKMEDLKHMADWQVLMQQSRSACACSSLGIL
jgi:TBC1 domain family member 14